MNLAAGLLWSLGPGPWRDGGWESKGVLVYGGGTIESLTPRVRGQRSSIQREVVSLPVSSLSFYDVYFTNICV